MSDYERKFPNRGVACDRCGAKPWKSTAYFCRVCLRAEQKRDPRLGDVCLTCGVSISDRPRALRCEPCAALAARQAWQRANARRGARRAALRGES